MQTLENALIILKTLEKHNYEAYLVGGCVRDMLLSKKPLDYDITTNARPEDVEVANAMKESKTARDMVLSWATQRPGANMERALNSLRLYLDRKPEMVQYGMAGQTVCLS